jgi:hypothetical protein
MGRNLGPLIVLAQGQDVRFAASADNLASSPDPCRPTWPSPSMFPTGGHRYVKDVADGWAAVLQPPAWTPNKAELLRLMLHANE